MNFFRGENEMMEYFKDNKLDYDTSFGLDLKTAFEVGKKIFTSGGDEK